MSSQKKKILDRGVQRKSQKLLKKEVALALTGSIGVVESIKLIRELRRHGAAVTVFVTPSVSKFIGYLSLEWASEKKVVFDVLAAVDHFGDYDLIVYAPLTLNTLSKIATGICDNPVTLLSASHWAKKTVQCFVPVMNEVLMEHPQFKVHQEKIEQWGGKFFIGNKQEDRLKMPDAEALTQWLILQIES